MKIKKSNRYLVRSFWEAHPDSLFESPTIGLVLNMSLSKLESDRSNDKGPKFIKIYQKVLYRKSAVLDYLKEFEK